MKDDAPTAPVLGSWGMGVQPRHSLAGERGFYGPPRCCPCSARSTIALLSSRSEAPSHPPASHAGSTRDPLTTPHPGPRHPSCPRHPRRCVRTRARPRARSTPRSRDRPTHDPCAPPGPRPPGIPAARSHWLLRSKPRAAIGWHRPPAPPPRRARPRSGLGRSRGREARTRRAPGTGHRDPLGEALGGAKAPAPFRPVPPGAPEQPRSRRRSLPRQAAGKGRPGSAARRCSAAGIGPPLGSPRFPRSVGVGAHGTVPVCSCGFGTGAKPLVPGGERSPLGPPNRIHRAPAAPPGPRGSAAAGAPGRGTHRGLGSPEWWAAPGAVPGIPWPCLSFPRRVKHGESALCPPHPRAGTFAPWQHLASCIAPSFPCTRSTGPRGQNSPILER